MEEVFMTNDERDIQRKLRVLQHAEKIVNARKACRYFGIGTSSFYRWRDAYQKRGEAGWKNVYFFMAVKQPISFSNKKVSKPY